MIRIKDLSISFAGNELFSKANFNINPKEKIGLIGRNGTGKSTLFKLLINQIDPDYGIIEYSKNYKAGILEQHIKFTKDTIIDEVCSVLNSERQYEIWKGEKILNGLGFTENEMLQDPKLFSGGFQVKINLAKLLLLEPNLLLLDEPTNYLDIHSIKWLKKILISWESEIILITHDRAFMDSIITHTLNIHRGGFKKLPGNTKKIKEQIQQEEIIHEKTRLNQEKNRKKTQEWIDRFKSKATLASRAQSKIKMLEKQEVLSKLSEIENLNFEFNYLNYNSKECLLETNNLSFGYNDNKFLINNFNTKINKGDKICIIGKNGKGKSTLLKLLHKEVNPCSGNITTHSKTEIGYFGQMNIDRLSKNKTIYEEIQSADDKILETKVRKTCAHMMFSGDLADKKISVLSGGEKSRVMLGKILLKPVNLLFLDEPTNHLDMESTESLMNAVYNFSGSVLMVTHDEYFLKKIANKLIIYDNGKVFNFNGNYKEFCKKIGWKDL
ncbi:MAG: putative ABC transporter ATP-binding protein YheS [Alphaproteobacteria bacterium MarineAlpha9_Bin3]|nr:MAG: putative ABC transporter ATP-binding protein YheS [Alphaproteobacteria bacterium MarineAlpha9_Bin3]|tara:strand:+ start:444 stop:1934 length:1491 start_codon:yes stop_codon:yes gene_type:complete